MSLYAGNIATTEDFNKLREDVVAELKRRSKYYSDLEIPESLLKEA